MRHEEDDDGVPVLNEVVESGNESIIQSSRLGREVLRELEVLQQEPVKFVLQEHILESDTAADTETDTLTGVDIDDSYFVDTASTESQLHLMLGDSASFNDASDHSEDEIELMIDEVVDRHITELRKDIRRLLNSIKQKT